MLTYKEYGVGNVYSILQIFQVEMEDVFVEKFWIKLVIG